MQNAHSIAIPADVLTQIEALFKEILTKLEPYRMPLTADDRRELIIVGDKTLGFLEKGKEYIELYPELIPGWLKKDEFSVDFEDVHNITPLKNLVDQVQEAVYNIQYLAGNEAYHWMLDYYQGVKQAAARNVPNAKIVADEMGKRFQRKSRRAKDTSSEPDE
ncbi:MAG: hypothetical protein LBV20_07350 [Treponema sp.]|jgi:hypothetical protein|nr:hypothetical protein [Treponema sp.]